MSPAVTLKGKSWGFVHARPDSDVTAQGRSASNEVLGVKVTFPKSELQYFSSK